MIYYISHQIGKQRCIVSASPLIRSSKNRNTSRVDVPTANPAILAHDALAAWWLRITSSIQARECSETTTPPPPLRFQSCLGKVREEVKKVLTSIS